MRAGGGNTHASFAGEFWLIDAAGTDTALLALAARLEAQGVLQRID
jgi:hypothetical protein